jgi:hypothetical protein
MMVRWAGSPAQLGSSAVAGSPASSVFAALVAEGSTGTARCPGREATRKIPKEPKGLVREPLEPESKPFVAQAHKHRAAGKIRGSPWQQTIANDEALILWPEMNETMSIAPPANNFRGGKPKLP